MQGPATFSYFIFNTPAPTPEIRSIQDCVAVIPGLDIPPPSMFKMLMSASGWSITHLANRACDRFRKRQMYQHPLRQICLPFNGRLSNSGRGNQQVCLCRGLRCTRQTNMAHAARDGAASEDETLHCATPEDRT